MLFSLAIVSLAKKLRVLRIDRMTSLLTMSLKRILLCLLFLFISNPLQASTIVQDETSVSYNKYAQLIAEEANANGVDPKVAIYIADQESSMLPSAKGDHETSFGIFQIHLPAHPEVTKKQALSPEWSIKWAISQLAKGNCRIWSTCPVVDG